MNTRRIFVAAILFVVAALALVQFRAQAQQTPLLSRGQKWEYGLYVYGEGERSFTAGRQYITPRLPAGTGSKSLLSEDRAEPDRAVLVARDIWNADALTLDALGQLGWEAVSTTFDGKRTTVLMKRPI
jgi:hypothetical protein